MTITFICERGDMGFAKKGDMVYTIKGTEKSWKLIAQLGKATVEIKYLKSDYPKFEEFKTALVEQGYMVDTDEA